MKPKLVIFDFDGTLGDTRHNIVVTLRRTMQLCGLELRDEAACAATIGLTLEDSFLSMYPTMSRDKARECVATYREIFYESIDELSPGLFPGVGDALARLAQNDIRMSIASSRSSPSLLLFLKSMGIAQYFGYVIGSDSVTHHKPHPEPVLQTLEHYGVAASDTLVVGDMPVDIEMAHNAGVRAVGVSYGNASRDDLQQASADAIVDNMSELVDAIARL